MIKKLTFILALLPYMVALNAGLWDNLRSVFVAPEKPKPPTIKVLINHDVEAAMLEIKGKHSIHDPYRGEHLSTHFQNKNGVIQAIPSGIKWGEEFPGVYQVKIVPESKSGSIYIDGVEYKGTLYVYDIGGSISMVNEIDIEEYIYSTLNSKVIDHYSEEALAALAIAARTQAYYQSSVASNPYWHVDGNLVSYKGHTVSTKIEQLSNAIASTRYMILSQTGTYEGIVTPFPVQVLDNESQSKKVRGFSVAEAESLALKGENASRILNRSFPNTTIELAFNPTGTKHRHVADAQMPHQELRTPIHR